MILTYGDLNKMTGAAKLYLALARYTGTLYENLGLGSSSSEFTIRGKPYRIHMGSHHPKEQKEQARLALDRYRTSQRPYVKMVSGEAGRIEITKVGKNGWWMAPETGYFGSCNSIDEDDSVSEGDVFVPLPTKVAKMGVVGTVFSGMCLELAGGVWRPTPPGGKNSICYNIYPPAIDS